MADIYSNRSSIIKFIFIAVSVIFIIRLFFLQIVNRDKYADLAEGNALRYVTQYPARGLIYDRNGELLVYNEAVYDLMVIPRQVKNIDTANFCELVGITKEEFIQKMKKARNYSSYASSAFVKQISKEEFGALQESLYKFKGFYVQTRTLRKYEKPIAAHVLGYIGEVNNNEITKNPYYKQGDYIGKSGLEKSYEEQLRGQKGKKVVLVDVHNREKGSFQNGLYDTVAIAGHNLYSTLDAELQEYAEQLMANKRGSIVAIEPSTGEVLAFVSAPVYDPNLLVGRVRSKNYDILSKDISKPLFNRALMAAYPPGSIFKVAQSLIALDLGVITPNTGFGCDKSTVGCHGHPNATSVSDAIKMSCNPYFYYTYKRIIQQGVYSNIYKDSQYGLSVWRNYMLQFGFGQQLGIDISNEKRGVIPDTAYYNKWYGRERWAFSTIYSNSIGQGEVLITPLQMANFAATLANRGYYYIPHLVRYYGDDSVRNNDYYTKHEIDIPKEYFDIAVNGMYGVVHRDGGTARRAKIDDIAICGKTGTSQNNGDDHSVFICFAPMDNPKIAVSVYVENARGGGGTWAAPIASLVVEKYLRGTVERKDFEKHYMEFNPCQKLPINTKRK
ncbi:MAG: penicillin-binding protein 2 [Bacteroidales bacterium]|nr:penicillin-binding protein 2 [Bacteroidales bacterium]